MRFLAPGLALSLLMVGAAAYGQDFSPVSVREYRPYSMLFLRFDPEPYPLAAGQSHLDLDLLAANSLNFVPYTTVNPLSEEDIEADRFNIRYARGLGKGWEFSGQLPIEDYGGGFLDPIIVWYHHTFLRLHNIRDQVPYGGHIVYSPAGGPFTGGFGLGDTSLYIAKTTGPSTFLRAGLKLPTGNPGDLLGSGAMDAGLAGQTTFRINRVLGLTLDAGVTLQGNATRIEHTRALVLQGSWSLVYAPNHRDSWILQAGYEQSPNIEGVEGLDKVEPSTTFAYRRELSARQTLTLYFIEDLDLANPNFPFGANVGPDPVIGLRWGLKL